MQAVKFQVSQYTSYKELPIDQLHARKYSIYIIDYDWNYLYANQHAISSFGGVNPTGKNIRKVWEENSGVNFEPVYNLLKNYVIEKKPFGLRSRSPLTKKAIEIVGHPLEDCYYFSIYELPDKESLLQELKTILKRGRG